MAARVLAHWADPRPAWLWTADGGTLVWRNGAAGLFGGKLKKYGIKRAPDPSPLRGQIARLIRLGAPNRASLSRMQFLLGEKPISATCSCTPLTLADGQPGLLVVAVDPIDREWLEETETDDRAGSALLPRGTDYLLIDKAGEITGGSARALETYGPLIAQTGLPEGAEPADATVGEERLTLTRRDAGPDGAVILLIDHHGLRDVPVSEAPAILPSEPLLPLGLPPLPETPDTTPEDEHWVPPLPEAPHHSLSSLFDRLVENEDLYAPLTDDDDLALNPPADEERIDSAADAVGAEEPAEVAHDEPPAIEAPQNRTIGDLIAEVEAAEEDSAVRAFVSDSEIDKAPGEGTALFRITGRGLTPVVVPTPDAASADDDAGVEPPLTVVEQEAHEAEADTALANAAEDATVADTVEPAQPQDLPPSDPETVERVSRYNFDELSRILTDRVGSDTPERVDAEGPRRRAESAQINLASETFVLNRLPLAILVFRDQQVLFANRALTEMTGHDGIESLRRAGLASIFPPAEQASESGGPVTQLLRSDGSPVSVTARLQSIPWHGRPALMLSASPAEARIGHEIAVKSFAEMLAAARDEGFVSADRSGTINQVSAPALALLERGEADLVGKPLTVVLEAQELPALKTFLERPARFAETARPSLLARGVAAGSEVLLFAEGQAGIVSGYFGFLRKTATGGTAKRSKDDADPALLGRVSRGVRRPLNTVIGFSDLIGAAAFGPIDNPRYLEYARDIKSAGQEIAALVDELDDYARLKDGRYAPRPADIDLVALLESCVVRVRGQANAARVLVRSGISERIPRIVADRASLGQAVLNLLASAIDQTPVGGSVVLSAQSEEDGSVAIHVRDSGAMNVDMTDRFVVFRDGLGRDGEALAPVRSSVGLALTRSLLAVNGCSLSIDPTAGQGTLFTLIIPQDLVAAS